MSPNEENGAHVRAGQPPAALACRRGAGQLLGGGLRAREAVTRRSAQLALADQRLEIPKPSTDEGRSRLNQAYAQTLSRSTSTVGMMVSLSAVPPVIRRTRISAMRDPSATEGCAIVVNGGVEVVEWRLRACV